LSEQPETHDRTFSQVSGERIKAAKQLGNYFEVYPDKRQAFEDLLRLCSDRDTEVREEAIRSLEVVFPNIPDRERAWENFINLTAYPEEGVVNAAVNALVDVFPLVPDKDRAWKELIGLVNSKSSLEDVKRGIVNSFPYLISETPNKQQVWKDLLEIIASADDRYVGEKAASFLSIIFPELPDDEKEEAWNEVLELATAFSESADGKVKEQAARTLGTVFSVMPDQTRDEALDGLFELAVSESPEVQKEILLALPYVFSHLSDRKRAWDDILRLTGDEDENVRKKAADVLSSIFSDMSDREKVWADFLNLIRSKDGYVRSAAASALPSIFSFHKDKASVWKELIELTGDEDEFVRTTAANTLTRTFQYIPEQKEMYSELSTLAEKKNSYVLREVIKNLASSLPQPSEKYGVSKQTFNEMKEDEEEKWNLQTEDKNTDKPSFDPAKPGTDSSSHVRKNTEEYFARKYPSLPDKNEVINELINLSSNPDPRTRADAMSSLLALYSRHSGKTEDIWNELIRRTEDKNADIRRNAAELLLHVFPEIKDKSEAFSDMLRLTESQDSQLRKIASGFFADAFVYSENKQREWEKLVRLAAAEDREVRKGAVLALSSGYAEVPDKEKGWRDLLKLSAYNDSFVQRAATRALGPAFFYVPDKTQAWRDLQMLTDNPYIYVRKYALRSLGRASLWRALKAENEATYIFGLKEAVKYYEEAAEISVDTEIPEFYLPFYEALLFILFSERSGIARIESERYLSKVTSWLGDQQENRQILEACEQFAGLLTSAGNLATGDLSGQKKLLETSIQTFDKYSDLFESREEKAILTPKNLKKEYSPKKEHPEPGKAILERMEKKKSALLRSHKKE
jgi:HEAT repeat protein